MLEPASTLHIFPLLLLRICAVACAALDCTDEGKASVVLELNTTHVARTWQPSTTAHCPWLESLHPSLSLVSSRVRTEIAEKSEPSLHWLVMELRRPMLVDRVSLQNWDTRRQATDSSVSALVAAGLPLELQLQDQCSANWKTFNDTKLWRQLGDAAINSIPVSFILLMSRDKTFGGQTVEVRGRLQQLEFGVHLSSGSRLVSRYTDAVLARPGDFLDFFVSVCEWEGGQNFECWLEATEGDRIKTATISKQESINGTRKLSFELEIEQSHHGALLNCGFLGQTFKMQKLVTTVVSAGNGLVAPPPVCIVGRKAVLEVRTDSYPEPTHRCKVIRSGATEELALLSKAKSVTKDWMGRLVIRQKSQFELPITRATRGQVVSCEVEEIGGRLVLELDSVTICEVSDPCVTEIDLGANQHWFEGDARIVSVRSHNCSIWNVSHSCWIVDPGNATILKRLVKIQQAKLSSSHSLKVLRWMGQRNWLIRCRVNQSGVEYADVYSLTNQQPAVFYRAEARLLSHSLTGETLAISLAADGRPEASTIKCYLIRENGFMSEMQLVEAVTAYQTWKFQSYFEARRSTLKAVSVICSVQQLNNGQKIYEASLIVSVPLTSNIASKSALSADTSNAIKTAKPPVIPPAVIILALVFGLVVVAIASIAIASLLIIQRRTVAAFTRREINAASEEQRNRVTLQPASTLYANLATLPAYPWDAEIYYEEETTLSSAQANGSQKN